MRKLYDRAIAAVVFVSAVLLALMLALVLVGVFWRYVFDDSLSWYDEFAGYLLVWLTMVGSVVGLAKGKHIGFDTLVERFTPGTRRVVTAFGHLCLIAFELVLLVAGTQLVREMADETAVSLTWVKMAWVYSIMPISGGLMLVISVIQLLAQLQPAAAPAGLAAELQLAKPMDEGQ